MKIKGSCHCKALDYTLAETPTEAMQCNCSICHRKGYLLAFSAAEHFSFEGDESAITAYTFGKHVIQHQFCKHCGCAPFGKGTGPDGREMVAVNLRCTEDFDLESVKINNFDGASL